MDIIIGNKERGKERNVLYSEFNSQLQISLN